MRTLALLLTLTLSLPAAAQDKTIKFLVGFPAGASLDTMTRLIGERCGSRSTSRWWWKTAPAPPARSR